MRASSKIYKPLKPDELRRLSELQQGRTELRILIEVVIISFLAYAHMTSLIPFWSLPFVLLIIGSRQHALLVLMHEGSHRRISKNKFCNDLIAEFIAWNFFAFMHGYRRHHHAHHQLENLNGPLDPDWLRKQNAQWEFPMRMSKFVTILVRDVLTLNTGDYIQEAKDAQNNLVKTREEVLWMRARIAYSIILVLFLIMTGMWKVWLLYWALPIFSFLKAIFRIRSIADHFCLPGEHAFSKTRTVLSTWWDRLLIGPCSIGIHGPHHLYPSIPYYNLREAHECLMKDPVYGKHAHVSNGYHRGILECIDSSKRRAQ